MPHVANEFEDIMNYILDRCGTETPGRSEQEIKEYLRREHARWDFGQDMGAESGLHEVINEMFDTGWIRGREAA